MEVTNWINWRKDSGFWLSARREKALFGQCETERERKNDFPMRILLFNRNWNAALYWWNSIRLPLEWSLLDSNVFCSGSNPEKFLQKKKSLESEEPRSIRMERFLIEAKNALPFRCSVLGELAGDGEANRLYEREKKRKLRERWFAGQRACLVQSSRPAERWATTESRLVPSGRSLHYRALSAIQRYARRWFSGMRCSHGKAAKVKNK